MAVADGVVGWPIPFSSGLFDEVQMHDRVLTPAEVLERYEYSRGKIQPMEAAEIMTDKPIEYYMRLPYRVEIYPEGDGSGYTAKIPDLPGCTISVDTLDELWDMIEEAKVLWLEVALADDDYVPEPSLVDKIMQSGYDWLVGVFGYGQVALVLWREWFEQDGCPIYAGEISGDHHCFFCGEISFGDEDDEHRPGCVFVRAKKLVEKADSL